MSVWNSIKSFFGFDSDPTTDDTYGYEVALTDSGYQILRYGQLVIDQPFKAGPEGRVPFDSPEEAEAAATAEIRRRIQAELDAQAEQQ